MNYKILLIAILLGLSAPVAQAEVHYTLLDLAGMYAARGNEVRALDFYAQAVAEEPRNIKVYEARAFYWLKLNRTAEALADFSAMIAIAPTYGAAYVSRGLVYSQLENKQRAESDFAAACALGDSSGCSFAGRK